MKSKSLLFIILSIVLFSTKSMADTWTCDLEFKAKSKGFQFILGSFKVHGYGRLACINEYGEVQRLPVLIKIGGEKIIGARVGMGYFELHGRSANISLFSSSPEDLLGNYLVANLQGSLGAGFGSFLATNLTLENVNMAVSLQLTTGVGLHLGLSDMSLELDHTRM